MSAQRFLTDFPSNESMRAAQWLVDPKNEVPDDWGADPTIDSDDWGVLQGTLSEVLGVSTDDIHNYIKLAHQRASIPISRNLTINRQRQLTVDTWTLIYLDLDVSWKENAKEWTERAIFAYFPRAVYILEPRRASYNRSRNKKRRLSQTSRASSNTSLRGSLSTDISIYLIDRRIEVCKDQLDSDPSRLAEITVGSLLPKEDIKLLCQSPIDIRNHHLSWDRFLRLVSIQGREVDSSCEISYYMNGKDIPIPDEFHLRNAIGLLHLELGSSTDPITLLLKRNISEQ